MPDPETLGLTPFEACRFFERLRRRNILGRGLLICALLVWLLLIVVNFDQGTLSHPKGWRIVLIDVRVLRGGSAQYSDPAFPLLRDYSSLILVGVLTVVYQLWYRQMLYMERFLQELETRSLIHVSSSSRVRSAASAINRLFRKLGNRQSTILLTATAIILSSLLVAGQSGGTFGAFAPRGGPSTSAWQEATYARWWASYRAGHYSGFLSYFFTAALLNFAVIKHNLVGMVFVSFFYRIRRHVTYRADAANLDGYYGWRHMRRLLLLVFLSVLNGIIGMAALFILLPADALGWTAPLFLLVIIGLPSYVILPLILHRRAMSDYKTRTLLDLEASFVVSGAPGDPRAVVNHAFQSQWVNVGMDTRLFRIREIVFGLFIYVIPAAAALAALVDTVLGR